MYPQPKRTRRRRVAYLLAGLIGLAAATAAPAQTHSGAHPPPAGQLAVTDAWARSTPPAARTGAVYLTITNEGREPDRLTAAASPAARAAELHAHAMEGGVARMRRVEAVEISPGEPAVLQPGGLHVMLVDLQGPLRDGQSIALTLTFEKAGTVNLTVPVRRTAPAGGRGPSHSHGH